MAGVDQIVFDFDVVDATTAFDELCIDAQHFLDFCRQTGGSRKVVSCAAIFDCDFHFEYLVETKSRREFTLVRAFV